MALRLIEAYIPAASWTEVQAVVNDQSFLNHWYEESEQGVLHLRMLAASEHVGSILDNLTERFSQIERFQVMVLPIEASIPRPEVSVEESAVEKVLTPEAVPGKSGGSNLSREELYADIEEISKPSNTYLAMVVLSSVVAGIGIIRNNTAIIVGAMVIAPLLGPNVGLALATTLADWSLARRALKALAWGIIAASAVAVAWGWLLPVDASTPGMAERTYVGFGDLALALAAGCAGVLSATSGAAAPLVGVMVAVALLPPLIACGLLLGSGHWEASTGALWVFLTNVICINLSGIVTFLIQGVRPLTWWETQKAKRATRVAIGVWFLLLLILMGVIWMSRT